MNFKGMPTELDRGVRYTNQDLAEIEIQALKKYMSNQVVVEEYCQKGFSAGIYLSLAITILSCYFLEVYHLSFGWMFVVLCLSALTFGNVGHYLGFHYYVSFVRNKQSFRFK